MSNGEVIRRELLDPYAFAKANNVSVIPIDFAYSLDWDGTTGVIHAKNSVGQYIGSMARLLVVGAEYGINPEEILAEKEAVEKTGSFDSFDAIEKRLIKTRGRDAYDNFLKKFTTADASLPSVVYQDTPAFLQSMRKSRQPHGILTAGQNRIGQLSKVAAGNFHGRVDVLDMEVITRSDGTEKLRSPAKGPAVQANQGPTGTYDWVPVDIMGRPLAVLAAREHILIDNNPRSGEGMPAATSHMLLVRRPGETISPRHAGDPTDNTSVIESLADPLLDEIMRPVDYYGPVKRFIPLSALAIRYTSMR